VPGLGDLGCTNTVRPRYWTEEPAVNLAEALDAIAAVEQRDVVEGPVGEPGVRRRVMRSGQ
jgi:hypothetical protein